jgi:hypothetical protein
MIHLSELRYEATNLTIAIKLLSIALAECGAERQLGWSMYV